MNYGARRNARYFYLTATLDAATWGAELAAGEGRGRIYIVEPTGPIEDDPNLTDKKFPGNPTKSYRTRDPLRVTGEIPDCQGHPPEALQAMRDHLERLKQQGIESIEESALRSQRYPATSLTGILTAILPGSPSAATIAPQRSHPPTLPEWIPPEHGPGQPRCARASVGVSARLPHPPSYGALGAESRN